MRFRRHVPLFALFFVFLFLMVSMAGCARSEWREVQGEPPIERVTLFRGRVTVYPSPLESPPGSAGEAVEV